MALSRSKSRPVRKRAASGSRATTAASGGRPRPAEAPDSTEELTSLIRQCCLIAKDAAFNVREFIADSSKMAFLAVKDCEKELDRMERHIDETISTAITEVTEIEARELLACLKFIIDLERIGDLMWSVAKRMQPMIDHLRAEDTHDLVVMAETVEAMLEHIHQGYVERDLKPATWVLQTDAHINQICRSVFHRHLDSTGRAQREYSMNLLFAAQAFERAGDHAKNLAEELFHLVEGRSLRHEIKRRKLEK